MQDIRGVLEDEGQRLVSQIGNLDDGVRRMISDNLHAPDLVEQADALELRGRNNSIAKTLLKKLCQVKHALKRLALGLYGICEVCNGPIEPDRLAFLPEATVCCHCMRLAPSECSGLHR